MVSFKLTKNSIPLSDTSFFLRINLSSYDKEILTIKILLFSFLLMILKAY